MSIPSFGSCAATFSLRGWSPFSLCVIMFRMVFDLEMNELKWPFPSVIILGAFISWFNRLFHLSVKSQREDAVCRSYKRLWTWEGWSRHCTAQLCPILDKKITAVDSKMNWRQIVASLLICPSFFLSSPGFNRIKINPAPWKGSGTCVYLYFISVVWNQKPVNSHFVCLVLPLSLTLWIIHFSCWRTEV